MENNIIIPDHKLYEAVFGLAIGDALGVPYEFKERGSFKCEDMVGYGTHHQRAGTWSDDTSMVLATLKSIKDNKGKIVIEDIRKNYRLWANEGQFTPDGVVFDIGISTSTALRTGVSQRDEYSNGNGSLMRILPLAFTDCTDEQIREVSAITHGHRISMDACVIYVHIIKRLLRGENIHDIIPTLIYEKPFDRLSYIDQLDVSEIRSTGYVVHTLEAALWCVSQADNSYRKSVLLAVNLGDDTDTTAEVAGGLAGIIYSSDLRENKKWFDVLRNKELILDCLWDTE